MAHVLSAHSAIRDALVVTPLIADETLGVLLKCEFMQHTGSFKVRGALHKLHTLSKEQRERGVIAASTGNHGMAVAYAARASGTPATIYVPSTVAPPKLRGIKQLGARAELVGDNCLDSELRARADAEAAGKVFCSPYNDVDVVAGQGTLAVELLEQAPDLDAVFVAVGGGGLIGGMGELIKAKRPQCRVIGVQPANSRVMLESVIAGRILDDVEELETLSDGTAGGLESGSVTLAVCQRVVDEWIAVDEAEIATALRHLFVDQHLVVEGAAACALAGFMRQQDKWAGKKVAVVLCGRNVDPEVVKRVVWDK